MQHRLIDRTFESELNRQQAQADNITTFRSYPFPGQLIEVPYPLDNRGNPVVPCFLVDYTETHRFPLPTCFHGRDVVVVVKPGYDNLECNVTLECGVTGPGQHSCTFFVNVTALLLDDVNVEYCRYRRLSCDTPGYMTPLELENMTMSTDDEYTTDSSQSPTEPRQFASTHAIDNGNRGIDESIMEAVDMELSNRGLVEYDDVIQG